MENIVSLHELELFLRLFLSALFGWLIGFERESLGNAAGTRTFALVTFGSSLFTIISIEGFTGMSNVDPSRVAAMIISGVGFLGAGLIIFHGDRIRGLTTAAGLWAAAGLGMAFGLGLYTIGVFSSLFILILLYLSRFIHPEMHESKK